MSCADANANRRDVRAGTRQLLISAATELLGERGSAGLTMTAVARRADVAVRTVYNHFSSTDDLVIAMMATVTKRLVALRPDATKLSHQPPEEALQSFVQGWFTVLGEVRESIDAVTSVRGLGDLDDKFDDVRQMRMEYLRTILAEAHRRDRLRVTPDEAETIAYVATTYQAWSALVPQLGHDAGGAAQLATTWVCAFAFHDGR